MPFPSSFQLRYPCCCWFFCCTRKVQGEQPLQILFIAQISGPAVGGGDGGVQFLVGQVQPGGVLVVEIREGSMSGFYLLGVTAGVEDG